MNKILKIVSGGQTGVDRAALDVALALNLSCGGFCPKGRKAEDGVIDNKYPLIETPLDNYEQRTEWNIKNSDATLILTWGEPVNGTKLTAEFVKKLKKNHLIMDMQKPLPMEDITAWISNNNINILNVAGPRASFDVNVYPQAREILEKILTALV